MTQNDDGKREDRMDGREAALVHTFVALADSLVDDYDIVDLTQHMVDDCVALLETDSAGLLLSDPRGGLQVLASTSEQARILDLLQLQSDAGPCLEAFRTGHQVLVDDLRVGRERWPAFADGALAEGFNAVFAIPLRLRTECIGALNLFRAEPGLMPDSDVVVAQALADVATIGILQQRVIMRGAELNGQLQTALNSRIVIEQAKGVLAERLGLDMAQAYARLRTLARNNNQHLSDAARTVVENYGEALSPDS